MVYRLAGKERQNMSICIIEKEFVEVKKELAEEGKDVSR